MNLISDRLSLLKKMDTTQVVSKNITEVDPRLGVQAHIYIE